MEAEVTSPFNHRCPSCGTSNRTGVDCYRCAWNRIESLVYGTKAAKPIERTVVVACAYCEADISVPAIANAGERTCAECEAKLELAAARQVMDEIETRDEAFVCHKADELIAALGWKVQQ
jgi:hypothetical protein